LNRKFVITLFVCWSRILQKKKDSVICIGDHQSISTCRISSSTSWEVAYDHQTCLAMLVPPLPLDPWFLKPILETISQNYLPALIAYVADTYRTQAMKSGDCRDPLRHSKKCHCLLFWSSFLELSSDIVY
jgi:hypothetical protein